MENWLTNIKAIRARILFGVFAFRNFDAPNGKSTP